MASPPSYAPGEENVLFIKLLDVRSSEEMRKSPYHRQLEVLDDKTNNPSFYIFNAFWFNMSSLEHYTDAFKAVMIELTLDELMKELTTVGVDFKDCNFVHYLYFGAIHDYYQWEIWIPKEKYSEWYTPENRQKMAKFFVSKTIVNP